MGVGFNLQNNQNQPQNQINQFFSTNGVQQQQHYFNQMQQQLQGVNNPQSFQPQQMIQQQWQQQQQQQQQNPQMVGFNPNMSNLNQNNPSNSNSSQFMQSTMQSRGGNANPPSLHPASFQQPQQSQPPQSQPSGHNLSPQQIAQLVEKAKRGELQGEQVEMVSNSRSLSNSTIWVRTRIFDHSDLSDLARFYLIHLTKRADGTGVMILNGKG